MTDATPYTVPKEPGRWRAIGMAALVHAALLAFLWIGVRWQNETPTTIEAEVWSPQPREAAPLPEPVKPAEPVEPEPKPVVKELPKPAVVEPPVAKPDIALEQEKKRKALEQKRQEEEREAKLKKQQELKAKEDQERIANKLKEEQRQQKEKAEKEQKEKAQKDKALADAKQKAAAEAKRKQQELEDKQLAKIREEELKRITGGVTGTGGNGEAAKSQGGRADSGYAGRVAAKIKSNISFIVPDELASNPPVEYVVDLLPDGSVASIRKTKSSSVPGFDEAVRRAIEKSQPYPKDKTGSVPSSFIGVHRPKDQ